MHVNKRLLLSSSMAVAIFILPAGLQAQDSLTETGLWFEPPHAEFFQVEEGRVNALMRRGDALVVRHRWDAARRAYADAAMLMREQRELAAAPLRRLANSYYFERRYVEAAKVLDELAVEAALFGDLPIGARALADAAWLYGKAGRPTAAQDRLLRLELLASSPYMPQPVRSQLARRVETQD